MSTSIHLPGLNGLRAIAALTVMWGHVFLGPFGYWGLDGDHRSIFPLDGVTLFFVISGFLITFLLLNERDRTDTVNIKKFYIRRILRIWPLYYAYLTIALIISGVTIEKELWFYLFFGANIPFVTGFALWPVVHYWSLGVEEQFYLFWPWIVKRTRLNEDKGYRILTYLILSIITIWIACKLLCWSPDDKSFLYRFFTITRFDCMMIGALGAVLYHQRCNWFLRFAQNRWVAATAVLLLIFSQWLSLIPAILQPQVVALVSLVAIVGQLSEQKSIINLENKIMDGIGRISYGIYVIHPLLIYGISKLWIKVPNPLGENTQVFIIYAIVTITTLGVAYLSYQLLELPFLKLKNKFAVVQSQSSMRQ